MGLYCPHVLIYKDGVKQVCNEEIIIQISNQSYLKKLFMDYEYTYVQDEFNDNQFLIKISGINTHQLFELTNRLNQDKNVVFAEPNFIRFMKPHTNDQFFSSQWSLNNQGYLGGNVDADMDSSVYEHPNRQRVYHCNHCKKERFS